MNQDFLQALYRWSVENSDAQIFRDIPPEKILSPEDRKWLEDAFDALIKDGYTLMKDMLSFIEDPTTNGPDKITAIKNLEELLENIDNSANFHKLDGWTIMVKYAKDSSVPLASAAMSCIAAGLQNHPEATLKATESGIMEVIKHVSGTIVNCTQPGFTEYIRSSSALVSSLLRSSIPTRIQALENGADSILERIINIRPPIIQLQQRTLHVLRFISSEKHDHPTKEAQQKYRSFVNLLWTKKLIEALRKLGQDIQMSRDNSVMPLRDYIQDIFKNIKP